MSTTTNAEIIFDPPIRTPREVFRNLDTWMKENSLQCYKCYFCDPFHHESLEDDWPKFQQAWKAKGTYSLGLFTIEGDEDWSLYFFLDYCENRLLRKIRLWGNRLLWNCTAWDKGGKYFNDGDYTENDKVVIERVYNFIKTIHHNLNATRTVIDVEDVIFLTMSPEKYQTLKFVLLPEEQFNIDPDCGKVYKYKHHVIDQTDEQGKRFSIDE